MEKFLIFLTNFCLSNLKNSLKFDKNLELTSKYSLV